MHATAARVRRRRRDGSALRARAARRGARARRCSRCLPAALLAACSSRRSTCGRSRCSARRCSCGCGKAPRRARRRWLGFWFSFGTFAAGTYWLYISIHVFGEAPVWLAFALMLGAGQRSWGSITPDSAMPQHAGCLRAGAVRWLLGAARRVAAHGMVARLVPVRVLVAFARVLPDRHLARRLCADRRGLWHQRAAAGVCRGAGCARVRHAARAHRRRSLRCSCCPGSAGAALVPSVLDPAVRAAGIGRRRAGSHSAGREVAREQPREHAATCTATLTERVLGKRSSSGRSPRSRRHCQRIVPYIRQSLPRSTRPRLGARHGRAACRGESEEGGALRYFNSVLALDATA